MHSWKLLLAATAPLLLIGCGTTADDAGETRAGAGGDTDAAPHVEAASPVEAGRYLIEVSGCNDCHTPGYLQKQGRVPQDQWLTGSSTGWQGPWGTTYPSNLRLTVRRMSEDEFVEMLDTRNQMPPMPWFNVHALSERDRRAIYRFIESLGPPGDPVPANLPPGEEPETPHFETPQITGAK